MSQKYNSFQQVSHFLPISHTFASKSTGYAKLPLGVSMCKNVCMHWCILTSHATPSVPVTYFDSYDPDRSPFCQIGVFAFMNTQIGTFPHEVWS